MNLNVPGFTGLRSYCGTAHISIIMFKGNSTEFTHHSMFTGFAFTTYVKKSGIEPFVVPAGAMQNLINGLK